MNKQILLPALIAFGFYSSAQDVHFTQFQTTPMYINPALTGIYDGKFRISGNYRSQWGAYGSPYKTVYTALDFPLGKEKDKRKYFGMGAMVVQDNAGDAGFFTTMIEGSLSYTTAIDEYANNYLAFGMQVGLNQRGIDLDDATWDNQWNGNNFDPRLPSYEPIQVFQFTYVDVNLGALWYYVPDGINNAYAGFSVMHFNKPNLSFYTNESDKADRKYTLHAGADIALNEGENTQWVSPKVMVLMQGKQKEIDIGGFFKNKVILKSKYTNFRKEVIFSLGGWYRLNDAVLLASRIEYGRMIFGVSYDITLSPLSTVGGFGGSPEFSLSYIVPIQRGEASKSGSGLPKFF